jgi:chemotaxis protein MotB
MAMSHRKWIGAKGYQMPQRWLTTFNDLVTLLLVFFVLVFALSSVDAGRYREVFAGLQSGSGVLEAGRQAAVGLQIGTDPGRSLRGPENPTEGPLREIVEDPQIGAESGPAAVAITLGSNILFDTAMAEILPAGLPVLDKVARVLREREGLIRIAGHTDTLPINTPQFPSNWELSTARAVNVLKYFVDSGGIDPRRLAAVGYGASKPLGPNGTPEQRARNRRVEIILVKEGG